MNFPLRGSRLAVIPARSGSKRLPGKNIRSLGGRPLVAWTIRAALAAGCLDRVIVSTDSQETADISASLGAEVPFLRPKELSGDDASTIDVVLHLLETLEAGQHAGFSELCILQPTSPYRTADDIARSYELFRQKEASGVISVAPCAHSPIWMNTLDHEGSMENFVPVQYVNKRSQDLPVYHRINGAIYWYKADVFKKSRTLLPRGVYAYQMDELRSVDIDTLLDFEFAEFLIQRGHIAIP